MANKARHAFGSSSSIEAAKQANKIDAYDILFLDGDTSNPKVGWIDAKGNTVIIQDKNQIVRVDELPTTNGDENVVYVYNNECYIWDGSQCVSTCKPADLTKIESELSKKADSEDVETLESQIATKANTSDVEALQEEVKNKVDADTVKTMIEEQAEAAIEVVEF